MIYKSAHQTIQIGYLLATLFDQAKFPSGVINFLIASNEDLDNNVFNNKYIRLVNFTGGTKNGKEIANKLPFGILCEVAPEVTGLLHKSEFSWNPNDNLMASTLIGDTIEVAILQLDDENEKVHQGIERALFISNTAVT